MATPALRAKRSSSSLLRPRYFSGTTPSCFLRRRSRIERQNESAWGIVVIRWTRVMAITSKWDISSADNKSIVDRKLWTVAASSGEREARVRSSSAIRRISRVARRLRVESVLARVRSWLVLASAISDGVTAPPAQRHRPRQLQHGPRCRESRPPPPGRPGAPPQAKPPGRSRPQGRVHVPTQP